MKNILRAAVALCLAAVMLCGYAFAETVEIENNPVGGEVLEVAANEMMMVNDGSVQDNYGTIDSSSGTVVTNHSNINWNHGTVNNNRGTVSYNYGCVKTNKIDGQVVFNLDGSQIEKNEGLLSSNEAGATVDQNPGIIQSNYGSVGKNMGEVILNFGVITNNNFGTVDYNFKGQVNGGRIKNDYIYRVDTPNFDGIIWYSGEDDEHYIVSNGARSELYLKEGASFVFEAMEGYRFADGGEPSIEPADGGKISINADGDYVLSDVTEDLVMRWTVVEKAADAPATGDGTPVALLLGLLAAATAVLAAQAFAGRRRRAN